MWLRSLFISLVLFTLTIQAGFPRDRTLSPEERDQLKQAKTVLIKTVALTELGNANTDKIQQVVSQRLRALGFITHQNSKTQHDVLVKVKCEERKTRRGPSTYGGDADSLHAPLRNWTGPACLITYGLHGHDIAWQTEVRTTFDDARRSAQKARVKNSGDYALSELAKLLEHDDFPYLLVTEWGQTQRLSRMIQHETTPQALKLKLISLLGEIPDPETLPILEQALQNPHLATSAAIAMGRQGEQATKTLLKVLQTTTNSQLKIAAVQGLGEIATHNSQTPVFSPFLSTLEEPTTELPVQTEIVLALGKLPDNRAIEPLSALNQKVWTDPSRDPEMQKLREALSWSLWQLNPSAHTGE